MKKIFFFFLMGFFLTSVYSTELFHYDDKGKRDPFTEGRQVKTALDADTGQKITELSQLEVQGIVWDAKNPLAIINDEIVSVGQLFMGATVKEIQPKAVILEYNGQQISLEVQEDEQTPLKNNRKGKGNK